MATLDLKFVQKYKDRHGKERLYFRRPNYPRVALRGPVGSAEFFEDYDAALKQEPVKLQVGATRIKPGTLGDLTSQYYQSARFRGLKPQTQANYRRIIDSFQSMTFPDGTPFRDAPVRGLKRRHLLIILDGKTDVPGAAYSMLKRLKTLFDFAIEREFRTDNPAALIRPPKINGFRALEDADIDLYLKHWPAGSPQRRAIIVLLYTGQRRSDAVRMGRQHIKDGRITVTQQKTGHRLEIPIHPVLRTEIDLMPAGQMMFITGTSGKPMTAESFTNTFRKWCKEAGLPSNSSPHGCRKAAGRRLAEAGCSAHQIMSILGHESLSEAERYTKTARQKTLADSAMEKMK